MRFLRPTPARRRAAARAVSRAVATVATAAALAACSFITGIPNVSRVELSVPVLVLAPGQSVQATGLALGSGGNVITNSHRQVTYSSSNDSVATVTATGVITGVAPGKVTIKASSDGKQDTKDLIVRPVTVRQVLIAPRAPIVRLVPGVATILGAAVLDTLGNGLTNRPPTWRSLDPSVVNISPIGAVTPLTLGTARVVASVQNGLAPDLTTVADTVTLRVTPTPIISVNVTPTNPTLYVGQALTFTATVTDSLQTTVTRRVVWSTADRGTALAIDSLTGAATAVAPAGTSVTASVETVPGFVNLGNRTGTVAVTVLAPAASVRVSPSTLALRTGAAAVVTFTAVDAVGNSLSNRTFRLTSSAPGVVAVPAEAVPSSYTVTAGATAGTATITVQTLDAAGNAQGTSATFTVTVSP